MGKRHEDALFIQQGACNPSAIAIALTAACAEIRNEADFSGTDQLYNDPAVRLIVHQLAFLVNVDEIDHGDDAMLYSKLTDECERVAQLKR